MQASSRGIIWHPAQSESACGVSSIILHHLLCWAGENSLIVLDIVLGKISGQAAIPIEQDPDRASFVSSKIFPLSRAINLRRP